MGIYCAALVLHLPQRGTEMVLAAMHENAPAAETENIAPPPLAMIAPFAMLLGTIAVFPLLPRISSVSIDRQKALCASISRSA